MKNDTEIAGFEKLMFLVGVVIGWIVGVGTVIFMVMILKK